MGPGVEVQVWALGLKVHDWDLGFRIRATGHVLDQGLRSMVGTRH